MDVRATRLQRNFEDVIHGRRALAPHTSSIFVEGLYMQSDAAGCVHRLNNSKQGLQAIQTVMRMDTSPAFMNGSGARVLTYFQPPELKDLGGGRYLQQIVTKIADPPIFWDAFVHAFKEGKLEEPATICFAWLLLRLVSLPGDEADQYRPVAQDTTVTDSLAASPNNDIRTIAHKIRHIVSAHNVGVPVTGDYGPGGRHDNDFSNFRKIAILPTADEITSKEQPFYRTSDEIDDPATIGTRIGTYLDNQFRLLREDMVYDMREELEIAQGKKKGHRMGLVVDGLKLLGVYCGTPDRRVKWGIQLECTQDLSIFKGANPKDRKAALQNHRRFAKHGSMACILINDKVIGFASIHRDEDLLSQKPPVFVVQLEGEAGAINVLTKLKTASNVKMVQIDTALFAYEPVLKAIQGIKDVPLAEELILWNDDSPTRPPSFDEPDIVAALESDPGCELQSYLGTSSSVKLDEKQAASLVTGLTQKVSLIQGPPGTGKSFIGALLAKILHDRTKSKILVCCYTNHALDQFLEDLMKIGIPRSSIVRFGGKATLATEPLQLERQRTNYRMTQKEYKAIGEIKTLREKRCTQLQEAFDAYKAADVRNPQLLEYLEFEDPEYFAAFTIPKAHDGRKLIGKNGKPIHNFYLLGQWMKGYGAGFLSYHENVVKAFKIWSMSYKERQDKLKTWKGALFKEQVAHVYDNGEAYNSCLASIDRMYGRRTEAILKEKRIIACTTTGAAKHGERIRAASPTAVLVEEAGEILESHVLTALGPKTDQLILIGDHKQLRPKVNNYALTFERGSGYNLNISLFERLVLKGFPHETLKAQHRMRPEISSLIRELTYPDLVDAPSTKSRPDIRGLRDNIVFINHGHPEDEDNRLADRRDLGSKTSKRNTYEAEMVLRIVRYLAQNGYGSEKLVVLTPYLGQLYNLQDVLKSENDPVLNDLDSFDLVRAGLMPAAAAKIAKNPLRLATIDNYQGEESDIVIATLTRSNSDHDIGFMYSPERLNVLLSRARNALIMIGNADTFTGSRKGGELWTRLFKMLRTNGHIHEGLPVRCFRHPDRTAIVRVPKQFDVDCPDGGCQEPCGTKLNCGIHTCQSKCHQLSDHSKMLCEQVMASNCPNNHAQIWKCHEGQPLACRLCEREAKLAAEKQRRDFELQRKRDAEQQAHDEKMAKLREKADAQIQAQKDIQLAKDREAALKQQEQDLKDMEERFHQRAETEKRRRNEEAKRGAGQAAASSSFIAAAVIDTVKATVNTLTGASSKQPSPESTQKKASVAQSNLNVLTGTSSNQLSPENTEKRRKESEAQSDWQHRKDINGIVNPHIDAIMEMIGLEPVKQQVLKIMDKVDVNIRQGTSLAKERFNVKLLGNPGTGKTTVARHYAKFLVSVDVLPGDQFVETTGAKLGNEGVPGAKKMVEEILKTGGGCIFIDEAYQLTSQHNYGGAQVLDYLLAEMENNIGKLVFILAGYSKQMEKFFEHNPGLPSRVPYGLNFTDYEDVELLLMLEQQIERKWNRRMKVEGGTQGLYCRIATKRLGRGRGREGFGNARDLQLLFAKITERQADRISKERRKGLKPDDFLLKREDVIGPDPSTALPECRAWKKLQELTGLGSVKQSVRNLMDFIVTNYQRELVEKEPAQVSLNRVFLGNPGTGKTTVAKLYGRILADLGLVSNGEVVVKNPADFVGSALGESEKNTKAILDTTVGKVLVVDEAYGLYGGGGKGGASGAHDPYKTAVIDTIVAEIQSVPGEDRCVLLLGYEEQMVEMFQNVNPGLARRFAIENAFRFEDFNDNELREIMNLKLKIQDLSATDAAKDIAIEVLSRSRNRPNFGNAGELENLLSIAKNNYQKRMSHLPYSARSPEMLFEPQDFDPDYERSANATSNLKELFKDVVGCDEIIKKLEGYQRIAHASKQQGRDPRDLIPTNFVFKGPPGTGKTTTARRMGRVYYDMGFLSSAEVVECSASDLVGQYVGQTGPKTKAVFERALGKVLFVDEAYRLSEGHFAKEAMDELVGILTQERFRAKLVVILAGYDQEINQLLSVNPGLSSRFPDEIVFENMSSAMCIKVLEKALAKENIVIGGLEDLSQLYTEFVILFDQLSDLHSWGNARDVITISKKMIRIAIENSLSSPQQGPGPSITLSAPDALACMRAMLKDLRDRGNLPQNPSPFTRSPLPPPIQPPPTAAPPSIKTTSATKRATNTAPPEQPPPEPVQEVQEEQGRDPGVTDAVWRQLQADKTAAIEEQKQVQKEIVKALDEARSADQKRKEIMKMLEEERLREAVARAERARKLDESKAREEAERLESTKGSSGVQPAPSVPALPQPKQGTVTDRREPPPSNINHGPSQRRQGGQSRPMYYQAMNRALPSGTKRSSSPSSHGPNKSRRTDLQSSPRAMLHDGQSGGNPGRSLLERIGPRGPGFPQEQQQPQVPVPPVFHNGMVPGVDMGAAMAAQMTNPLILQGMTMNQMALMAQMTGAMGMVPPGGFMPGQPGFQEMGMANGMSNGFVPPHQREAKAQERLRHMGVCPVGYRWIKQAGGYRCAGGSHFVTDSELGF